MHLNKLLLIVTAEQHVLVEDALGAIRDRGGDAPDSVEVVCYD